MNSGAQYCKSVSFRGFPQFIRELGGRPERYFAEAGLDMSYAKKGNNYYDWAKACNLLELAARDLKEPYLGLKWAHNLSKDGLNSGPILLLGAITKTVRDFFELANKYQKIHINGVAYSYAINTPDKTLECEVQVHPLSPPCRQFIEHIMACCILMERHYVKAAQFTEVTFQHSAPQDLYWYEKTFQCDVSFNAEKNLAISYPGYLDAPLGGKLNRIQPFVRMCLEQRLNKNERMKMSISETVEHILPTVLGMRKSSLKDIAQILELNPKKLQRLLNDEGNTYSEIVEKVTKAMAIRFLSESDIMISHLAAILDYSSNEAFNTACKRWFGTSPSQYRRQLRREAGVEVSGTRSV